MKKKIKLTLKFIFALFFIAGGIMHILSPETYLPAMPDYLPFHYELVILSGIAELALGFMLLVPRYTPLAAWGLVALLVAIFPANVEMYLHPEKVPDMSETFLLIRLPLQGVLIWWAYWYTKD